MKEILIYPKYLASDLYKIYFEKRGTNIFFYKEIRSLTIVIISIVFILLIGLFATFINQKFWIMPVVLFFILFVYIIYWIRELSNLYKWKKSIDKFVKLYTSFKSVAIVLTENSITLNEDDEQVILTWSDIKSVTIDANNLILYGTKEITILRCSITEVEFEEIREFVNKKVQKSANLSLNQVDRI